MSDLQKITLYLKIAGICIVVFAAIMLLVKVKGCLDGQENTVAETISVPSDSHFAPIEHNTFQPTVEIPFVKKKEFPAKLPEGVKQTDVDRVITLETKDSDRVFITETNKGEVFVQKDSSVREVTVTVIEPPLFKFQSDVGLGFTFGWHTDSYRMSPSACFAPLQWSGWLNIPNFTVDLDGIGVGGSARLYHDIFAGVSEEKMFNGGSELKATIHFMF